MNPRTQLPVYYDDVKGWILLSNEAFEPRHLSAIRDYVHKVNTGRLKDFQGDKRKRVEHALERLKKEGLTVMADFKGGSTLFQATEKSGKKSYFNMGGN